MNTDERRALYALTTPQRFALMFGVTLSDTPKPNTPMQPDIQSLIDSVRQWGEDKGITGPNAKATLLSQLSKTQEELTETRDAAVLMQHHGPWTHDAEAELKDGIGDCTVTLILAAELAGLNFEECLAAAYDEIKGRTGKMVDGQFVKDSTQAKP